MATDIEIKHHDEAEQFLLDFTASTNFEQIKYLPWTSADVIGLMADFKSKTDV